MSGGFAPVRTRQARQARGTGGDAITAGAGPQITGILSDLLAPQYGQESLRYALLLVSFVNIWSAWHYYLAGRYLAADLAAGAAPST